jgi:imidazolonepropionase-like amidohydrolase
MPADVVFRVGRAYGMTADRVGTLAPGAFADIVGFRDDLMDDPGALFG